MPLYVIEFPGDKLMAPSASHALDVGASADHSLALLGTTRCVRLFADEPCQFAIGVGADAEDETAVLVPLAAEQPLDLAVHLDSGFRVSVLARELPSGD